LQTRDTMNEGSIEAAIQKAVDAGALGGAATLVWRSGRVAHAAGTGWRDIGARLPMERNTLFRIASMTKPITSTAALMLLEEGRFSLHDPIARFAPEFATMRVLRTGPASLADTVPAGRPITFEDLLTHRSGLTYGAFHPGALERAYDTALGGDIDSEVAPDDWIAGLAALPLIDQPGAALHYGHSTDLLGLLVARIEDAPLGDVLQRRIFGPLGMSDTGFTVERAKRHRRARLYGFDDEGRLTPRTTAAAGSTVPERPDDMEYVSGGQGLWSTVDDYLAFARMFLGAGAVDGVRLLRRETLATMVTNRLTSTQRASSDVGGLPLFAAGHGFGLGVAVVLEPQDAEPTLVGGGRGAVGWPGGFGGWWRADPANGSVLIFLAHNVVERDQFAKGVGFGVYGAIAEFQTLASADGSSASSPALASA
jgi:CubicO group peptidase (beta-lactamase class C family)